MQSYVKGHLYSVRRRVCGLCRLLPSWPLLGFVNEKLGLISKALLLREPFGRSESLQWGALRRDAGAEKEKLFIHTPRDSVVQANVRCSAAPGLVSENLLP